MAVVVAGLLLLRLGIGRHPLVVVVAVSAFCVVVVVCDGYRVGGRFLVTLEGNLLRAVTVCVVVLLGEGLMAHGSWVLLHPCAVCDVAVGRIQVQVGCGFVGFVYWVRDFLVVVVVVGVGHAELRMLWCNVFCCRRCGRALRDFGSYGVMMFGFLVDVRDLFQWLIRRAPVSGGENGRTPQNPLFQWTKAWPPWPRPRTPWACCPTSGSRR